MSDMSTKATQLQDVATRAISAIESSTGISEEDRLEALAACVDFSTVLHDRLERSLSNRRRG